MHVKEAHPEHSLKMERCWIEDKVRAAGPCQEPLQIEMCTYLLAQVAIVICVFCCCLDLDCAPMSTPLFNVFFSAGSVSGTDRFSLWEKKKKKNFEAKIEMWCQDWNSPADSGDGDHKQAHTIASGIPGDLLTAWPALYLQEIINANCSLGTCRGHSFLLQAFIAGI